MIYAFIIIYMLLFPVTVLLLLLKILDLVEKLKNENKNTIEEKETKTQTTRKHYTIGQSKFDNAFGGRKAYEIYKNTNGLYEPITPSRGIPIKKKEE